MRPVKFAFENGVSALCGSHILIPFFDGDIKAQVEV